MRNSRGTWLPLPSGARVRGRSLYRLLRDAVMSGALEPGARLPSTRVAAAEYGVSRGMVEEVYSQLAAEGFL